MTSSLSNPYDMLSTPALSMKDDRSSRRKGTEAEWRRGTAQHALT